MTCPRVVDWGAIKIHAYNMANRPPKNNINYSVILGSRGADPQGPRSQGRKGLASVPQTHVVDINITHTHKPRPAVAGIHSIFDICV